MSTLTYRWDEPLLHLKIHGMSNHELRRVLLGLWRRLDPDDRKGFIDELQHYSTRPDSELPPLSLAIAFGEDEA